MLVMDAGVHCPAGNGLFEKGYGRKAVLFKDHVILTPCAKNTVSPTLGTDQLNLFSDPVEYTNTVWAAPALNAADPGAWFQIAPLPVACNHSLSVC